MGTVPFCLRLSRQQCQRSEPDAGIVFRQGDGALHLLGVLGQLAEHIGIQIEAGGHVHGHPAHAAIGAAAPAGGDAAGVAGGGGDRAAACTAIFPWRDSFLFLERLDI